MPSGSSEEHRRQAAQRGPVAIGLVTVSDTRTSENDVNGQYLSLQVEAAGHEVRACEIIRDDPELVMGEAERTGRQGSGADFQRRDGHFEPRQHFRRDFHQAGKDAARLRRAVPDAVLGPGWRRGDAVACSRGCVPGHDRIFDARIAGGRSACVGKADRAGTRTSRRGNWAGDDGFSNSYPSDAGA